MSDSKRRFAVIFFFISVTLMFFQNCAEEFDESQYNSGSTANNSSTSTTPTDTTPAPTPTPTPTPTTPAPEMPTAPAGIAPQITSHSGASFSVNYYGVLNLSVGTSGTSPLTFKWYKNGTLLADNEKISGATTNALRLVPIIESDAGTYSVQVQNGFGTVSQQFVVSVNRTADQYPPALADGGGLKNLSFNVVINTFVGFEGAYNIQTAKPQSKATFTVVLKNTTNVTYEWYFINSIGAESRLANQNGSTLTIDVNGSTYGAIPGTYKVKAINPYGSVTSSATLSVIVSTYTPETSTGGL